MSVAEKLNTINNIKQDIKAALEYKGLTVTDQFDTYAEQIRSLGNADSSEDPFASIGYYKSEQMPWLGIQIDAAKAVIDSWNPESTTLKGENIMFYPLIDTRNVTSMNKAFASCSNLRSVATLDTGNVTDMSYAFQSCTQLITIPELNTPKVVTMSYMFDGCKLLEYIPSLRANNLTNTSYMFQGCTSLKQFPLFENMGKLTNMAYMFSGCTSLEYAYMNAYDTSSVTNMTFLFNGCAALKEVSFVGCDLSKVTTWSNIVYNCSALTKVDFTNCKVGNGFQFSTFGGNRVIYDNIDTSAMTDTSYLFSTSMYNNNVDVSNMNFSNVTDMSYMFQNCQSNSITIGNIDTGKVTNTSYMFDGCNKVTDLDLSGIDVSKVATMAYMFNNCSNLQSINFTGWNTDSLTNMQYMFQNCQVLDTLDLSMFDTSKLTNINYLFYNSKINSLILDGWDFSSISSNTNWLTNQSSKNVSLKNVKAKGAFTCPYASESIDLSGIDTTACTSFKLNSCDAPTINLSSVNTSNFTSMESMFSGCSNITSLNISHFDYSKVTTMSNMFYGCSKLESITMGGSNKVTNMSNMFYGCNHLTKIDLTNLQLDLVTNMDYMFYGCTSLKEVKMGGNPAKITNSTYVEYMFNGITTEGVLYYNTEYDYSKIIAKLPSTWKALPLINISNCTSLTIEADDVNWSNTSTTIRYTAVVNGTNPASGATMTDITLTGEVQSSEFEQNLTDTDKTITISYTLGGRTASTTITQGAYRPYTVNLNDQWQLSTDVANPDSALYDGVYESFSNRGLTSRTSTCTISITGYETFSIYVRSDGESSYDYVTVYDLDSTSAVKKSFQGLANSGTTINDYTLITFTNIDPSTDHTITINYYKDQSTNSGTDRGYLLIPKNQ